MPTLRAPCLVDHLLPWVRRRSVQTVFPLLTSSHTLLAGRPWVAIEHNGQHYRLQTTRAGKLILTK
jgi:hemin uptake protein HemP